MNLIAGARRARPRQQRREWSRRPCDISAV